MLETLHKDWLFSGRETPPSLSLGVFQGLWNEKVTIVTFPK